MSREGAFFPFCVSGYRQSPGTSVHIVRLSSARLWVLCRHDPCIITSIVARLSSDGEANCKNSQHQYQLRILGFPLNLTKTCDLEE